MADIFLSYSHEDQDWARRLTEALTAEGFSVWWDHQIPPGRTWDEYIGRALNEAKAVIVLWSKTSAASNWVKEEASIAEQAGKFVSLAIDNVEPPMGFRRYQAGAFKTFNWDRNDPRWRLLVDDLRLRLREGPSAAPPRPSAAPARAHKPRSGRGMAGILIGLALLLALGGGAWYALTQLQPSQPVIAEAPATPTETAPTATSPAPPPAALDPATILGEWRGQMLYPGETADITFIFAPEGTFHAITGYQGRGSYDARWEIVGQELRWGCTSGGTVCFAATPTNGVMAGTATTATNADWRVDFRVTKAPATP